MKLENLQEIMGALEKGQLSVDFTSKLREALASCGDLDNAKASVTLKLKIAVKDRLASIEGEVEAKMPKPKRRSTHLWFDEEGNPHTSDPRQMQMFQTRGDRPRVGQTIDN